MTKLLSMRKTYPTLIVEGGSVSEIYLEHLVLKAIENFMDKGEFGPIVDIKILVPFTLSSEDMEEKKLLHKHTKDKVLVDFNVETGEYLFGPINERTVSLTLYELKGGKPLYRSVSLNDLHIFDTEMVSMLETIVNNLPSLTGSFTLTKTEKLKRGKGVKFVTQERTLDSLIFLLRNLKYKSLAYCDIYKDTGVKPMTLVTAYKHLKEREQSESVLVFLTESLNIKSITPKDFIMDVHGTPEGVINNVSEYEHSTSFLRKQDGTKIYVSSIQTKIAQLNELVSKETLGNIKYMFNMLPSKITKAVENMTKTAN